MTGKGTDVGMTEKDGAKLPKQVSLERFRQKIGEHGVSRAVLQLDHVAAQPVSDPEVAYVNVPGLLTGGCAPVAFKANGTLVVLCKLARLDRIALFFHERHDPNRIRQIVACTDQLGFGGAFSVQFLF